MWINFKQYTKLNTNNILHFAKYRSFGKVFELPLAKCKRENAFKEDKKGQLPIVLLAGPACVARRAPYGMLGLRILVQPAAPASPNGAIFLTWALIDTR